MSLRYSTFLRWEKVQMADSLPSGCRGTCVASMSAVVFRTAALFLRGNGSKLCQRALQSL